MKNIPDTRKLKHLFQCLLFLLIICIGLKLYYRIIVPKYFTDEIYSVTTTHQGFYDLEKDSADVIFFGPSSGTNAFVPQELYNKYGITSYNLSCEDQSLLTSYHWLKEALRSQSPKVVVVEASKLFDGFEDGPLVSEAYLTAKAFEGMKWSHVKLQAVLDICTIDPEERIAAYIFPNIRYHERDDISGKDFSYRKMSSWSELKGYTLIPIKGGYEFEGFEIGGQDEAELSDLNPLMKDYLDKMVALCAKENIQLVLVYAPSLKSKPKTCNALEAYAKENGLRLIDFNDRNVLTAAGYDFPDMSSDKAHSNIWGAMCITDYVGGVLAAECGVLPVYDEGWEDTREYFDYTLTQAELIYMTDADEYLEAISDERYSIDKSQENDDICYEVSEKRTGRLVDIGVISDTNGHRTLTHREVDYN